MTFMHYIHILMCTYDRTYCIFDCIYTNIYTHVYMHIDTINKNLHMYLYTCNSARKACTKIEQCLGGIFIPEFLGCFFFFPMHF